jgi:hypothetical protein
MQSKFLLAVSSNRRHPGEGVLVSGVFRTNYLWNKPVRGELSNAPFECSADCYANHKFPRALHKPAYSA